MFVVSNPWNKFNFLNTFKTVKQRTLGRIVTM